MSQPDYNRPNQLWQCGGGCNCPLGPSRWGRCRSTPRCSPSLSLRGRRGVFVATCLFATLGLLLLALCQPERNVVFSPGELSGPHQQALREVAEAKQCSSCHDAAEADPLAWLMIASDNIQSLSEGQATRCLECHRQSIDAERARFAHNVSPESLASLTAQITKTNHAASDLLRVKLSGSREIACATCHREHHGIHANLTQLSDQQCQSCHAQAFESFSQGHPEFRHTLPSRRSRIAFDHVSHAQKHFPGKQAGFNCNQCHIDDASRNVKLLAGFEKSCAQCHSQPIEAATLDGLVVLTFPTLDVDRLRAAGHDIGSWPQAATGDFDGVMPPMVRVLLLADDEASAALDQLGAKFEFSQARPEQYPQVSKLAWAYKRLLNDLANDSAGTLRARFDKMSGASLDRPQLAVVLRQLPPALMQEARRRWFPALDQELAKRDKRSSGPAVATAVLPQVKSELLAENPLARPKDQQEAKDSVPGITWWTEKDQPAPSAEPKEQEPSPSPKKAPPATTNGSTKSELLAENPLSSKSTKPKPLPERSSATPPASAALPKPAEIPPAVVPQPPVVAPPAPSELASSGTWYLDDASLSARYRPRGHADELLRLLIDVAASATHPHVPHDGLLPQVLADMSLKSCASCHSIDSLDNRYEINWLTQYRDPSRRQFTEFSHRPHLVQPKLQDCNECHRMNTAGQGVVNYETTDPIAHAHDFQPIVKSNCVTCHLKTNSGGNCTTCHSYHVGSLRGTSP